MDYSKLFNQPSSVDVISEMVSKAGNRAERRKILKTMNKIEKIEKYTRQEVTKRNEEELANRSNDSFAVIMSAVGVVLHEKYGWNDDLIGEMFGEIVGKLNGEWVERTPKEIVAELEAKTGIELVVK